MNHTSQSPSRWRTATITMIHRTVGSSSVGVIPCQRVGCGARRLHLSRRHYLLMVRPAPTMAQRRHRVTRQTNHLIVRQAVPARSPLMARLLLLGRVREVRYRGGFKSQMGQKLNSTSTSQSGKGFTFESLRSVAFMGRRARRNATLRIV